ncbi:hypothetical protein LCGC14_0842970 [marine sediment metagenome]|uniref:N-acetylmuramoyl-L-alanine amidase domain-containing protein n=1 Tax=marine sediment metagenome TaxID=412755 RepID=A0A0F9PHA3_9ZZZZ
MTVIDATRIYPIPLVWPRPAMDLKRVDAIAIHHTVTFFLRPDATVEEELAHIDMIHRYHLSKGWGGFAYHLISFPSGRVYHVVPLTQWGAHVHAENDHLHAIVVAGDFTDRVPVLAQQEGVVEGIRLIYATLGRQVSIRPHRSWNVLTYPTACPGATWQQWVPGLTALVEEDDMAVPPHYHTTQGAVILVGLLRHGLNETGHAAAHAIGSEDIVGDAVLGLQKFGAALQGAVGRAEMKRAVEELLRGGLG